MHVYSVLCFLKRHAPEQQEGEFGSCPLGEVQASKGGDNSYVGSARVCLAGGDFWSAGVSRQAACSSNEMEISMESRKQLHNHASETYHSKPLCPCKRNPILQSCFPV